MRTTRADALASHPATPINGALAGENVPHTPLPWKVREGADGHIAVYGATVEGRSNFVCRAGNKFSAATIAERARANAALIVRAVNRDHAFDDLVKALGGLLALVDYYREHDMIRPQAGSANLETINEARAALAKEGVS